MQATKQVRLAGQDRRTQILGVAMELFASRGFRGTTTRQIAEASGVNEAIIFRHFPRKEDLYWAVIEQKCRDAGERKELLRRRLGEHKPDNEIFTEIAEDLLILHRRDPSRSRLFLFAALENHQLSDRFFQTYVVKYYEILAQHIAQRVREGIFRPVDPLLAARGFLGMVVYHFWIQDVFGGARHQKFEPRRVAETLADIWLRGVRATPSGNGNGKLRNGRVAHATNGKRGRNREALRREENGNHLTVRMRQ
jgi:AcrR family transcriptional regulator